MVRKMVRKMVKKMIRKATRPNQWRTVGIIGAGRHTGVTHLCLWLANYRCAAQGQKTAVLEWNRHGDLVRMEAFCRRDKRPEIPYSVLGVDYYAEAGMAQLVACLDDNYETIIVDYGEITGASLLECARCDKKIIVGALSEWQAEAFLEVLRAKEKRDKSWCLAVVFGSEETRREAEKTFHHKLFRIPVSVDAFAVTRTDMNFFQSLLK